MHIIQPNTHSGLAKLSWAFLPSTRSWLWVLLAEAEYSILEQILRVVNIYSMCSLVLLSLQLLRLNHAPHLPNNLDILKFQNLFYLHVKFADHRVSYSPPAVTSRALSSLWILGISQGKLCLYHRYLGAVWLVVIIGVSETNFVTVHCHEIGLISVDTYGHNYALCCCKALQHLLK